MANLSPEQVARVARSAGFAGERLVTAVAVSFAENGKHDPAARHRNSDGSTDYGLWQINSVHGFPVRELLTPAGNAQAAYKVSGGGVDFRPWTTYPAGMIAQRPAAVRAIRKAGVSDNPPGVDELGQAGLGVRDAEHTAADAAITGATAIPRLVAALLNRETWIRVGMIIFGLVAVAGALFLVAKTTALV